MKNPLLQINNYKDDIEHWSKQIRMSEYLDGSDLGGLAVNWLSLPFKQEHKVQVGEVVPSQNPS